MADANKVYFKKGTKEQYDALDIKDGNTFYLIDKELYVGDKKVEDTFERLDWYIDEEGFLCQQKNQ